MRHQSIRRYLCTVLIEDRGLQGVNCKVKMLKKKIPLEKPCEYEYCMISAADDYSH